MKSTLIIALLWLAGSSVAPAQNITTNLATGVIWFPVKDEATHDMLRGALKETDPLTRVQALAALTAIGDPADVPLINGILNDPVPAVREQARRSLSLASPNPEIPEKPPVLTQTETLDAAPSAQMIRDGLTNPNVVIQQAAVDAVGRQRSAELAPAMIPLLKSLDSVLRRHICEALGKTSNDQGTALAEQLAKDEDPFVQGAAAEALLALHTNADREALLVLLKNARASVRMEAVRALGQWAQPPIATALPGLLVDHDANVVRETAEALGRLGNPESKQPLIDALPKDQTVAQERMAWALGELHATEAVSVLETAVNKMAEPTQASAAEALGKIGDPHSIAVLQKVLVDMTTHGSTTRQRAIEALQRLGDRGSLKRVMQIITEKVVPPLQGSTQWQYDMENTRAAGVRYLEFLGDPQLASQLLDKLTDMPTYQLRKVMAATISKLTGKTYMAAFSRDSRHYWLESLNDDNSAGNPANPGIVLVP